LFDPGKSLGVAFIPVALAILVGHAMRAAFDVAHRRTVFKLAFFVRSRHRFEHVKSL